MTPLYETQWQRDAEENFRNYLLQSKGLDLVKMPRKYVVDFVAYDDECLHSLWEFKQRSFSWGDFSTIIFPLYKMVWVRQYRILMPKVPVHFAVQDANGEIRVTDLPPEIDHRHVREGGRDVSYVREDPSDTEPVYLISVKDFYEI